MICAHGKKLTQEVWAKDDLGNSYHHWVHVDDGEPCPPDMERTFERCDRLCAAIRAFRKLNRDSAEKIQ